MIETIIGLILLIIVLIVPGYFLTLGLFPSKKEIDGIERIAFSFIFSIAFLPLIVLFENQILRLKINYVSVISAIALIIIVGIVLYYLRTKAKLSGKIKDFLHPVKKDEIYPIIPILK